MRRAGGAFFDRAVRAALAPKKTTTQKNLSLLNAFLRARPKKTNKTTATPPCHCVGARASAAKHTCYFSGALVAPRFLRVLCLPPPGRPEEHLSGVLAARDKGAPLFPSHTKHTHMHALFTFIALRFLRAAAAGATTCAAAHRRRRPPSARVI
jgi:hypothetical protein